MSSTALHGEEGKRNQGEHDVVVRSGGKKFPVTYALKETGSSQARLRGRSVFRPQFDLGRYRAEALIDYLEIRIEISKPSQFQYLQRELAKHVSGSVGVTAVGGNPSSAKCFLVKFQEPNRQEVEAAIRMLDSRWFLAEKVSIVGLEVSLDFYPRDEHEDRLPTIAGILQRHFIPDGFDTSKPLAWPRVVFTVADASGQPMSRTMRLIREEKGENIYQPTYVDGTTYVGAEQDSVFWRVMMKKTDRRRSLIEFRNLPREEWRARIEVNFKEVALRKLGIEFLEDLVAFKFSGLQKEYFSFCHVTVPQKLSVDTYPNSKLHARQILIAFCRTGVIGALHLDRRLYEQAVRSCVLRKEDPEKDPILRDMRRVLSQKRGHLVAYAELNAKAQGALRQLSW